MCGCPDWERLVYVYLRECTEIENQSLRVLHLAPEPGIERRLRQRRQLDYRTLDFLAADGTCPQDAPRFDYPDNSFDVILCNHVLEHVAQDRCAMSEVFRVLRPGGWALLQVPISFELSTTLEDWSLESAAQRHEAFGQRNHVRLYGRDYCRRLQQAGFEVEIFEWTQMRDRFGGASNLYNLNEAEKLFIGHKPDYR